MPPATQKIYHIVNVDRLGSIVDDGAIWCDRRIIANPRPGTTIGMGQIKERRLQLPVKCWPGDCVGDYVPFYFCPRSVMLYVLHMANAPELAYRGGQGPIIHLEADLALVVAWANQQQRRWAFTLSNAGAGYTQFRNQWNDLDQINWAAVANDRFAAPEVKEPKQAEFLVHDLFPWHLVERIGVRTPQMAQRVADILMNRAHRPQVQITPHWYF
jgi:hypothetical protein